MKSYIETTKDWRLTFVDGNLVLSITDLVKYNPNLRFLTTEDLVKLRKDNEEKGSAAIISALKTYSCFIMRGFGWKVTLNGPDLIVSSTTRGTKREFVVENPDEVFKKNLSLLLFSKRRVRFKTICTQMKAFVKEHDVAV